MKRPDSEDSIVNCKGIGDMLSEAESWEKGLKELGSAWKQVSEHPYAGILLTRDGDGEAGVSVGVVGGETLSTIKCMYALSGCKNQTRVCEVLAIVNQGYVVLRKAAELIVWAGMYTTGVEREREELIKDIAKNLGAQLTGPKKWARKETGVVYWPEWKNGLLELLQLFASMPEVRFGTEAEEASSEGCGDTDISVAPSTNGACHDDILAKI